MCVVFVYCGQNDFRQFVAAINLRCVRLRNRCTVDALLVRVCVKTLQPTRFRFVCAAADTVSDWTGSERRGRRVVKSQSGAGTRKRLLEGRCKWPCEANNQPSQRQRRRTMRDDNRFDQQSIYRTLRRRSRSTGVAGGRATRSNLRRDRSECCSYQQAQDQTVRPTTRVDARTSIDRPCDKQIDTTHYTDCMPNVAPTVRWMSKQRPYIEFSSLPAHLARLDCWSRYMVSVLTFTSGRC